VKNRVIIAIKKENLRISEFGNVMKKREAQFEEIRQLKKRKLYQNKIKVIIIKKRETLFGGTIETRVSLDLEH